MLSLLDGQRFESGSIDFGRIIDRGNTQAQFVAGIMKFVDCVKDYTACTADTSYGYAFDISSVHVVVSSYREEEKEDKQIFARWSGDIIRQPLPSFQITGSLIDINRRMQASTHLAMELRVDLRVVARQHLRHITPTNMTSSPRAPSTAANA